MRKIKKIEIKGQSLDISILNKAGNLPITIFEWRKSCLSCASKSLDNNIGLEIEGGKLQMLVFGFKKHN